MILSENDKQRIRLLIAKGNLDQAIQEWRVLPVVLQDPLKRNEAILLAMEMEEIKKAEYNRKISYDQKIQNLRELASSLLYCLDAS